MSREIPSAPIIDTAESLSHKFMEMANTENPSGLIAIKEFTDEAFISLPEFQMAREVLGKDPESIAKVQRAVTIHEFPPQSSMPWEQYKQLLQVSHLKESLSRSLILRLVEAQGASFGLHEYEQDLLTTSCRAADTYDELCLLWREDVQQGSANKQAKELILDNPYTIVREKIGWDEDYEQVPLLLAYPDQVILIQEYWIGLAHRIKGMNEENTELQREMKSISNYLRDYSEALLSINLDNVAEQWRRVDRRWMKIKGRLQPIGSREYGYYDPNGIRVFPDFRLSLVVEGLTDEFKATQQSLLTHLGNQFGFTQTFKESRNALQMVQVYPAEDIVFAGSLDFQPTGQSLPNEAAVQKEFGTKTYLNARVNRNRWQSALNKAQLIFPEDYSLFEKVDPDRDGMAIMVAGHEYGEPLFQSEAIERILGKDVETLLNEDRATLCITGILPDRVASGELPEDVLLKHATFLLGAYLRYIEIARGAEHFKPYYIGMGLLGLRRMLDSGFIYSDGNWKIDPSKIQAFYDLSKQDLKQQVSISEQKDRNLANRYLSYAQETPEIQDLINQVLRPNS